MYRWFVLCLALLALHQTPLPSGTDPAPASVSDATMPVPWRLAQSTGSVCETPSGVCPLYSPQPIGSVCTCPTSSGSVEGVTR